MKKAAVLIPLYKNFLDKEEILSFNQCQKVLGKHEIIIFGPESLDFDYYITLFERNSNLRVVTFADKYFINIHGYNKLMLSSLFYQKFVKYEYILIYQLDSWVFRDELEYWCNKKFHYIGAPWFADFNQASEKSNFIGVGNGGFSLRHVSTYIKAIRHFKRIRFFLSFLDRCRVKGKYKSIIIKISELFLDYKFNSEIIKIMTIEKTNEDYILSHCMSTIFNYINVAKSDQALKFSFEVNPHILFKLNNYSLPFGCHAFLKYNPEFYKYYIQLD